MAVVPQVPVRVGREPVVAVAVEHDQVRVRDPARAEQRAERLRAEEVAPDRVLQVGLPVEADRARDVRLGVERRVLVDLDDTHDRVVQMLFEPARLHEHVPGVRHVAPPGRVDRSLRRHPWRNPAKTLRWALGSAHDPDPAVRPARRRAGGAEGASARPSGSPAARIPDRQPWTCLQPRRADRPAVARFAAGRPGRGTQRTPLAAAAGARRRRPPGPPRVAARARRRRVGGLRGGLPAGPSTLEITSGGFMVGDEAPWIEERRRDVASCGCARWRRSRPPRSRPRPSARRASWSRRRRSASRATGC